MVRLQILCLTYRVVLFTVCLSETFSGKITLRLQVQSISRMSKTWFTYAKTSSVKAWKYKLGTVPILHCDLFFPHIRIYSTLRRKITMAIPCRHLEAMNAPRYQETQQVLLTSHPFVISSTRPGRPELPTFFPLTSQACPAWGHPLSHSNFS